MFTTGLNYFIDYEKLNEEFGFISFSWQSKKQFHNGYQLDSFAKEINLPILATVYLGGKEAFVMYQKLDKQNPYQLINEINRYQQEYQQDWDNIKMDFIQAGEGKEYLSGRYLLQLLINSLGTDKNNYFFNNVNGNLLSYLPRKFVQGIWKNDQAVYIFRVKEDLINNLFLDISTCNMILRKELLNQYQAAKKVGEVKKIEQFKKLLQRPTYILNPATGLIERFFPQKEKLSNTVYLIAGRNGRHISSRALETKSLDDFYYSRVGILKKIMTDLNKKYQGIVALFWQQQEIEYVEEKRQSFVSEKNIKSFVLPYLQKKGLILINKTKSQSREKGQLFLENIAQDIEKQFGIKPKMAEKKEKGFLHLVLIHEENFYQQQNEDPYSKNTNFITQHLTLENLQQASKKKSGIELIWKNCLKELILLADFYENQISVLNWSALELSQQGKWIFGQIEKEELFFVEIKSTGEMLFKHFQEDNIFTCQHLSIVTLYSKFLLQKNKNASPIYFVISPEKEVYFFIQSEVRIIPNIDNIAAEIEKIYEKEILVHLNTNKKFLTELKKVVGHYSFQPTTIATLERLFNNEQPTIKLGKEGIWHKIGEEVPRSRDERKIREVLRMLGLQAKPDRTIKYLKENMPAIFTRTFWRLNQDIIGYTMGYRFNDYQGNFSRFQRVWYLKSQNKNQDMNIGQYMMPLMDNDFIAFRKTYTVLPFPFKYLREYIQINRVNKLLPENSIPFLGEQLNLF